MTHYELVGEFHATFDHPQKDKLYNECFTSEPKLVPFRISLMKEELQEFKDAYEKKDYVDVNSWTYKKYKNQNREDDVPVRKAKKKKKVDNSPTNTLESFYVDGEMHEIIPKSKITTLDGGQF